MCVKVGHEFKKKKQKTTKLKEEMAKSNLASVAQLIRVSSHAPKGHRFNFWSGHILELRV